MINSHENTHQNATNERRNSLDSQNRLSLSQSLLRNFNSLLPKLSLFQQSNDEQLLETIETKLFQSHQQNLLLKRDYVYIRNNSLKIWTLTYNTTFSNEGQIPIVFIHGYCGGVGLWAHNITKVAQTHPVYAFDLIGFGRSSRPSFSLDSIVAEQQFVESIEDWRKELGLKEMILVGHAFGGFLSCAYSLKYPQYTKALILVDPWGFPESNGNLSKQDTPTPMWIKFITNLSRFVSPLSVFRATGSIGVSLFKYLRPDFGRKYSTVPGGESGDLIYEYLYYCNKLNPSGEIGFKSMSEYYGFAKNPMIKRVEKVNSKIPIWFIYGSRSWIDPSPGFSTKYMRNQFSYVSVKIVSGAGHLVYADKPDLFNNYLNEIIDLIDAHDETDQSYPESVNSTQETNS